MPALPDDAPREREDVASFTWDVPRGELFVDGESLVGYGFPPGGLTLSATEALGFVHEDDRDRVRELSSRVSGGGLLVDDFRIVLSRQVERRVRVVARGTLREKNHVIEVGGTIIDVTSERPDR